MSRGPGKWQRAILDELQAHEWIMLGDVLPPGSGRSARYACRRAAKQLRRAGQVELRWVRRRWWGTQLSERARGAMLVLRVGTTVNARDLMVNVSLQNSGQIHLGAATGRHALSVSREISTEIPLGATIELQDDAWTEAPPSAREYRWQRQGITAFSEAQYTAMLERHHGGCWACGRVPGEGESPLVPDHDRVTGEVRRLLCGRCNRAYGLAQEDPNILKRLWEFAIEDRQAHLGATEGSR
jgi:Recombination endonuclease VII